MTVGSVQDVMLAAVAVGGMKGESDLPEQSVPQVQQMQANENAERQQVQQDPLTEEQTAYITEQLNEIMRNIDVDLQFQYHKEVNFMSVRMLDKKTGEVLREVPPEAMVEHMIRVHDWIGAFLDKTA